MNEKITALRAVGQLLEIRARKTPPNATELRALVDLIQAEQECDGQSNDAVSDSAHHNTRLAIMSLVKEIELHPSSTEWRDLLENAFSAARIWLGKL